MLRLPIHWGLASDVGITFFESVSRKNYKELLENLKISLLYPYIWLEWETHVGSPSKSENKTSASIHNQKINALILDEEEKKGFLFFKKDLIF